MSSAMRIFSFFQSWTEAQPKFGYRWILLYFYENYILVSLILIYVLLLNDTQNWFSFIGFYYRKIQIMHYISIWIVKT